jgi:serine/threonine-protein kinase
MPVNFDRQRTGGAFEGPLAQNALPVPPPLRELSPGDRVGPFRIERELSRGGMGVVYLARRDDGEFEQRVAIEWMSGAHEREVAEALFRRERDIVASLEHPGIARLIDGGREADNMLWFAMEYVEGEPIDALCEARMLPLPRRVALVHRRSRAGIFQSARCSARAASACRPGTNCRRACGANLHCCSARSKCSDALGRFP